MNAALETDRPVGVPGTGARGIHVLHVNTEPTWRGGEQQVLYLARGQRERGHEASIACLPGSPMATRAREAGIPVHEVPMRGEADLLAAFRLAGRIRGSRVDVVHAHTTHAHTLCQVSAAISRRRPARVVTKRTDFSIFRHSFLGLNRIKYRHGVDAYVAISGRIREVLVGDGLDGTRITVVHSGIDPERLAGGRSARIRTEMGIPPAAPVIGNIAHCADHKGQRYLVAAAPSVLAGSPEARIVIVGDGELRPALETRARDLGVAGRVLFPGFREDVADFLDLFDVFAMPSHLEGLGTAVLDAMACRVPVVACRAGGIPEAVEDGVSGLLVAPRDPEGLATAILRILADPDLARRLADTARERVLRRFSVDAMVEGNLAVYGRAIATRNGTHAP